MSRFFVGQPVRIVRCYARPWLYGAETRVRSFGSWTSDVGGVCDIELDLVCRESGKPFVCDASQIEPTLPSGAAPSEYTYTELMDRLKAGEGVPA